MTAQKKTRKFVRVCVLPVYPKECELRQSPGQKNNWSTRLAIVSLIAEIPLPTATADVLIRKKNQLKGEIESKRKGKGNEVVREMYALHCVRTKSSC